MSEIRERFTRFFRAVHGADPYPWQRDLVETLLRDGRWPSAITAPTGAGKSSVVDVHVFAVAEHARRVAAGDRDGTRRPPRRLVLVAPRRVLVDDQYERARELARTLARRGDAAEPIVAEVAAALDRLRTAAEADEEEERRGGPLGVALLRGGVRLDLTWRLDPARCQIVCATPQMWGSRLLFRGFRGAQRTRNLETGLLGHDVAVVIDEAHLHERLVETASHVAELTPGPLALQVVAMSATRATPGAIRLGDGDLADRELRRRVLAGKRVERVPIADWRRDATRALVEQARRLAGAGTVGVFVNTVGRALEVAGRLDGEVALVCGRMRPADVEALRERWPGLLDRHGNAGVDYLVTTQSLEVGVDLDLPAIVSEIASAPALAQRAGRLNRSGRYDDATFAVVLPDGLAETNPDGLRETFAPYAARDVVAAARWLERLDGDASPQRISESDLPMPERPPMPALTPVELETCAIADLPLAADVDPSFYVEEPTDYVQRTIAVAARRHLADGLSEEVVRQMLLAAPPRAHELASFTLDARAVDALLDACPGSWVLRGDGGRRTAEPISPDDERMPGRPDDARRPLQPGDVVIVPDGSPICTRGVIEVGRRRRGEPFEDVSDRAPDGQDPDAFVVLDAEPVRAVTEADPELSRRASRRALAELVEAAGDVEVAARLRTHRYLSDLEVTWCDDGETDRGVLTVVSTGREGRLPRSVEDDGIVHVDDHNEAVAERMTAILDALDVDDGTLGATRVQLIDAARHHDDGKRAPRFQQRMGAQPGDGPLAKPRPGHVADRGDGWRHEQLSAGFAWVATGGDPVVAVVDAGHHGHGSLFDRDPDGLVGDWDECPPDVRAALGELFGPCGRYALERARLQRSIGVHGLAYLEALLRCADMQISREGR